MTRYRDIPNGRRMERGCRRIRFLTADEYRVALRAWDHIKATSTADEACALFCQLDGDHGLLTVPTRCPWQIFSPHTPILRASSPAMSQGLAAQGFNE
jgi:hypothetical protein